MTIRRVTICPELVLRILYGAPSGRRYTQDSPVLPEVWIELGKDPAANIQTLIVPRGGNQAHHVANELYDRIQEFRGLKKYSARKATNISDIPGIVSADLHLDELVNVVLPLTSWWQSHDFGQCVLDKLEKDLAAELIEVFQKLQDEELKAEDQQPEETNLRISLPETACISKSETGKNERSRKYAHDSTVRLLVLLAIFTCAKRGRYERTPSQATSRDQPDRIESLTQISPAEIGTAIKTLIYRKFHDHMHVKSAEGEERCANEASPARKNRLVFTISLNRKSDTSAVDSVPTTKADAARRLFQIDSTRISWAVIDSGIDASHYAFKRVGCDQRAEEIRNDNWGEPIGSKESRIQKKLDLTMVHELRNRDVMFDAQNRNILAEKISRQCKKSVKVKIEAHLDCLMNDIKMCRPIDWDIVEDLITVKFETPLQSDHGTHVAGILGGGWPEVTENGDTRWVDGMCPDISIYDFKVTAETMEATEFAIISAMRLIRHMNERNDYFILHGANLSLSIKHDVTNYACGRTPVCEECNKLVDSGVVVVAAAGNDGYNDFLTKRGSKALHTTTSITDPGNAEAVITVGSTHRREPHTYGVSYFSSRGPTGDGRAKPDLVAPGEKIDAPVRYGEFATLEGTSMAAPHVSGAAAMLMARFPELVGEPRLIKKILCSTATDLGRERFFQGHGLLDILRALQSV